MGFTGFGKPLSDAALKEITQTETAIEQLNELKTIVTENADKIGPIVGLAAKWPWSESRKIQAKIDLVKQMVGKSLEGGVLRKEDEEKYKKILATMTDEPSTALSKINGLISTLQSDVEKYKSNQALAGRNVPGGETSGVRGIVQGFDISSYATDPTHEEKIASIVSNIGQFNSLPEVESYIRQVAPQSPVTADMIGKASEKYGVPWEILVAMMQQDSSLGTAGLGARTNNPGNVGNDDSGNIVRYPTWEAGVEAVASWLSRHRTQGQTATIDDLDFTL
jgi:hypothetical protein